MNGITFEVKNDFGYKKFKKNEWEKALNYFLYLNKHDDLKDYILFVYYKKKTIKILNWNQVERIRFKTEKGFSKISNMLLNDLEELSRKVDDAIKKEAVS